ncbi:MAG TPA: AMP-dependent synthetase, partial [Acidobacteria bacterium]|nr:AMP-dependent synthetase [Acidobacteriota bacterium]
SLGGATEASIWSILFPVEEVAPDWVTIPYGYPMTNQSWEVIDRNGSPCPVWVPGELAIRGAGLAQG